MVSGAFEWYRGQRHGVLPAADANGLRYAPAGRGFYVCVRLHDGASSLDAANDLIETLDVVAIPGVAFGEALEGWLRLSWVAPIRRRSRRPRPHRPLICNVAR